MSDTGRKDFSTKAKEEIVNPDSSKSAYQQLKEGIADTTDRAAAAVKPDDKKSGTQQTFDKGRCEKDVRSEGPVDKVKNALGLNE